MIQSTNDIIVGEFVSTPDTAQPGEDTGEHLCLRAGGAMQTGTEIIKELMEVGQILSVRSVGDELVVGDIGLVTGQSIILW